MPTFGKPSRFAIQYELDADYGKEWLFGCICVWFDGKRIGRHDERTSLRDVLFEIDQQGFAVGKRRSARFEAMSAEAAFHLLDSAMYTGAEPSVIETSYDEQWARHKFLPTVDVLGGWKAYVIESENRARILYADHPYKEVQVLELQPGEVDTVLAGVQASLDQIYEREMGPPTPC